MTERQAWQFNRMRRALIKIGRGYQTTEQLRRSCRREFGLAFEEALEMAYENIQQEAQNAVRGVRTVREVR